jgi:uncharacterized membrane protein
MRISQRLLAAFFSFAGVMHFLIPKSYEATVPPQSPVPPKEAVQISGVAEIAGGLAVLDERTRPLARWWLLGLLLAVFPANIYMAVKPEEIRGLDTEKVKPWMLWARLPLQFLMMIWVWRATRD